MSVKETTWRRELAALPIACCCALGCNVVFNIEEKPYVAPSDAGSGASERAKGGDGKPTAGDASRFGEENGAENVDAAIVGSGNGFVHGPALVFQDGWVRRETNQVNINGSVFTNQSALGATIEPFCPQPPCFEGTTTELCVSGSTGRVVMDDFANYWAAFGFNLAELSTGVFDEWDRGDVLGFSFRVRGEVLPTSMRIQPGLAADPLEFFCKGFNPNAADEVHVPFAELLRDCWMGAGDALPEGAMPLDIAWQIPGSATEATPFDLCVGDIRPILGIE